MTTIFNERTKIIGVDPEDGRLPVDTDPIGNTVTEQLLEGILTVLKKIEYHLSIATDTNLNDQDV